MNNHGKLQKLKNDASEEIQNESESTKKETINTEAEGVSKAGVQTPNSVSGEEKGVVHQTSTEDQEAQENEDADSPKSTEVEEKPIEVANAKGIEVVTIMANEEGEEVASKSAEKSDSALLEVTLNSEKPKFISEDSENEEDDQKKEEKVTEEIFDFAKLEKKELLSKLKEAKNEENIKLLDHILRAAKLRFDELFELAKNEALQRYVSEGNETDSFDYHGDQLDKEFITIHGQLKAKRNKHFKDRNDQRESNLKKKEQLLEKLRKVVDGEESIQSIDVVKELQGEWKKIGSVSTGHNNNLWANYNALLDRYYDNRSIYFELKDLDRKKNMKLKLQLCEKAEQLVASDDLKSSIMLLNELHEEYKHIGPVLKDDQESIWQRFKAASDAVYSKRKEYFEELKKQFEVNLSKKEALIKEVEVFVDFNSERITEWNDQTKRILDLQKRWEAIGGVSKEKSKAVNRLFWNAFKKFFANKNQFFKSLESQRDLNLHKKQELIAKANELKESEDWNSTAQKLKNLQAEWKEIGPVSEKDSKEIYAKFKKACDHFFNRRRDQNKEKFKEYDENLNSKTQICDQLGSLAESDTIDLDQAYELIDNYTSIGFVPKNAIKRIARKFENAVEKVLANKSLEEEDRRDLKNHMEIGRLRNTSGGNQKIKHKENSIRKHISLLENDISTWNTNMEFFANSATADKLKADMKAKVEAAKKELGELKSQLRLLS